MSWDNVKGVSAAKIWIDNPDTTQAYLFANGNHQVKLTVGISFVPVTASDPSGPTEDEVKAALTLIDYQTGAGLSHLKEGDKGEYTYIYQPNLPVEVKSIAASDSIVYQYEFDYYISSDSTINNNYASEQVALLISPPNIVPYSTDSSSKSQSYVAVTVYPPKKYGIAGSESTPIVISKKDDKSEYSNNSSYGQSNEVVSAHSLRIDDSYLRLIKLDSSDAVKSPNSFTRHAKDISKKGAGYYPVWQTYEAYLLSENKINQGSVSYDTNLSVNYSDQYAFFSVTAKVHQESHEIMFIHFSCDIEDPNEAGFKDKVNTISLSGFDQFGNKFTAIVSESTSGFNVDSVN